MLNPTHTRHTILLIVSALPVTPMQHRKLKAGFRPQGWSLKVMLVITIEFKKISF